MKDEDNEKIDETRLLPLSQIVTDMKQMIFVS